MHKLDGKETKDSLLGILVYIDSICRENHLNYSLYAGTLLGGARHKGFIPWDDDVDIMMPYPDYKKFIQLPEINTLDNRYTLHYATTENLNGEKYVFPFPKVEDNSTIIKFSGTKDEGGAYVDIFPLTGFPRSKEQIVAYSKSILDLRPKIPRTTVIGKGILRKTRNKFYRLNYKKYRDAYMKLVETYDYDSSNEVGQNIWPVNKKGDIGEHFPKEWLKEFTTLSFEGYNFMVISEYEKLLELEYGDWKKLPPKEEQRGTHDFVLYRKD